MKVLIVFGIFWSIVYCSNYWRDLPKIPAGSRTEYYLSLQDGGYKYGYDTGTGSFAKQNANAANEVKGQFGYSLGDKQIGLKYTAGVEGFSPELSTDVPTESPAQQDSNGESEISNTSAGDASRSESGDENGNGQGDAGGKHDLYFSAGPDTGFVITGGNFIPIVVADQFSENPIPPIALTWGNVSTNDSVDRSYNFSYQTDILSRNESGDAQGNIEGQYAYKDNAGEHDLSYKAGDDTGFIVTGGNLAILSGVIGKNGSESDLNNSSEPNSAANESNVNLDPSASESEVNSGNMQKETIKPDLIRKPIVDTGFQVTEETLSVEQEQMTSVSNTNDTESSLDGSSSSNSNEDSSHSASSDSQGNVNEQNGFAVTQGSLTVLNASPNEDSTTYEYVREYIHPKLLIPFNGHSVVQLLPVNENAKVGYILS